MTFGGLLSQTPILKAVGWKQLHHNHGRHRQKWPPIAAHELQFWEHTCWIKGERCPEQADIFFLQWGGLLPLECSDGKVMMAMNLASSSERFKGNRPPHCKKKKSAWSGHCSPSIRQVCAWHWSSCAAMGGHFRRRQPWWWGVLLTMVLTSPRTLQVGIVGIYWWRWILRRHRTEGHALCWWA